MTLLVNNISIPSHLTLPAIISLLILLIIVTKWKKLIVKNPKRLFWISLSVFCFFYGLIVGGAAYTDILYQIELNSFDLDQDGLFDVSEITEEQEAAMNRLISDVGRNFSVFTGLFFAGILSVVAYVIGWGIQRYLKLKKEETN